MNIRLLRMVQRRILKYPEQFNMQAWYTTNWNSMNGVYPSDYDFDFKENKGCKTAACIGGWVAHIKQTPKECSVANNAMIELKLSVNQFQRLCFLTGMGTIHWPANFETRYHSAKTPQERAQVASERIDHFIATKGEE